MRPYKEAGVWLLSLILFFLISGCKSEQPDYEAQVREGYNSFVTLVEAGVNAMLIFRLEDDGTLTARIERPTQDDLESFYIEFMERPLCESLSETDEIVACLLNHILEHGCVRITTCSSCMHACPE
ncbi:hypothetical protein [Natronoflexus pectinivorans]|uniref:Uncharacterized protein n=1 Tax=Natronoflexus pectinivorans TaxID=682526 RepID=A0A4R2GL88_9BACT|nr:hypothetical protein [Natronoflexus pectinivorans]TCO09673.1 hypothetical protein EV194_10299 [Natronoflexus pectinivorans]